MWCVIVGAALWVPVSHFFNQVAVSLGQCIILAAQLLVMCDVCRVRFPIVMSIFAVIMTHMLPPLYSRRQLKVKFLT